MDRTPWDVQYRRALEAARDPLGQLSRLGAPPPDATLPELLAVWRDVTGGQPIEAAARHWAAGCSVADARDSVANRLAELRGAIAARLDAPEAAGLLLNPAVFGPRIVFDVRDGQSVAAGFLDDVGAKSWLLDAVRGWELPTIDGRAVLILGPAIESPLGLATRSFYEWRDVQRLTAAAWQRQESERQRYAAAERRQEEQDREAFAATLTGRVAQLQAEVARLQEQLRSEHASPALEAAAKTLGDMLDEDSAELSAGRVPHREWPREDEL